MEATAHHAAVTVSDLDRVTAFYRDELGLAVVDRFVVEGEAFADAVGVPGATGQFVHLDGGGARIELVEYDPEGEHRPDGALNEPGTHHLGLAVEDVEAAWSETTARALSEPRTTDSGTTILFLRDPEGNLVELIEA
jgi:catechol 2,3-dioxygenase-like lactoylglutathione lyase family enzyme